MGRIIAAAKRSTRQMVPQKGLWLSLLLIPIVGCVQGAQVSPERYNRAQELVEQGVMHLRVGAIDEAASAFSGAQELAPTAAAVDGQGCVALLRGDMHRAEELFRRSYAMDSNYHQALANLALLLDLSGRISEAKILYEHSIGAMPEHSAVRNNKSALEYDQGAGKMEVVEELRKAKLLAQEGLPNGVVEANIKRLSAQ